LRAYVHAVPYRAFNIDESGAPVQTYTIIVNKGATSARNVQQWGGINLFKGSVPERFEDLGDLIREEGKFVLPPDGQGFIIRALRPITKEELGALRTPTGDLRLCAFGKITYEDEFGAFHWTIYCHVYFGPERLDRGNGQYAFEQWQAKFTDYHNETDKDQSPDE
jgi:hypothetical protein